MLVLFCFFFFFCYSKQGRRNPKSNQVSESQKQKKIQQNQTNIKRLTLALAKTGDLLRVLIDSAGQRKFTLTCGMSDRS